MSLHSCISPDEQEVALPKYGVTPKTRNRLHKTQSFNPHDSLRGPKTGEVRSSWTVNTVGVHWVCGKSQGTPVLPGPLFTVCKY